MIIQLIFSLLLSLSIAKPLELTKLGARDPSCQQKPDETMLTVPELFVGQKQQLFQEDKLNRAIVAGDFCYRVGTEINLQMEKGDIQQLGKAFISKVESFDAKELQANKSLLPDPPLHLEEYLKSNQNKKVQVVHFQIMEKLADTSMTNKYDRLQTCFVSYADWTTYPLSKEKWQEELDAIKSGATKAEIWNGTVNCYKVGIYAELLVEGQNQDFGSIIPTAVYLTHYSQITEEQAQILGEDLKTIKDRMAQNKDKYGGYTTMVVYDYVPPKDTKTE